MKKYFDLGWKFISKTTSKLYLYLPINDENQKIISLFLSKTPKNCSEKNTILMQNI